MNLTLNLSPDLIHLLKRFLSPSVNSASDADSSSSPAPDVKPECSEAPEMPEFKYIHVEVTGPTERTKIHRMMCNIVRLPRLQQVCDELYKLMKKRKVLCTINPEAMLKELRRLGLPGEDQDGFSQKNFQHYYRAPKIE